MKRKKRNVPTGRFSFWKIKSLQTRGEDGENLGSDLFAYDGRNNGFRGKGIVGFNNILFIGKKREVLLVLYKEQRKEQFSAVFVIFHAIFVIDFYIFFRYNDSV